MGRHAAHGGFAGIAALAAGAALTLSAPLTASASIVVPGAQHQAAARQLPDFGSPAGHAAVPQAAATVNTSHLDHVVGSGTAASCTSAAVVKAVARGGIITFNCGPAPVKIKMNATARCATRVTRSSWTAAVRSR